MGSVGVSNDAEHIEISTEQAATDGRQVLGPLLRCASLHIFEDVEHMGAARIEGGKNASRAPAIVVETVGDKHQPAHLLHNGHEHGKVFIEHPYGETHLLKDARIVDSAPSRVGEFVALVKDVLHGLESGVGVHFAAG